MVSWKVIIELTAVTTTAGRRQRRES